MRLQGLWMGVVVWLVVLGVGCPDLEAELDLSPEVDDDDAEGDASSSSRPVTHLLEEEAQFSGESDVRGIAWDAGRECLWVVDFLRIGEYYDNNRVSVYCLDLETREKSLVHRYEDEYTLPTGVAFDGEFVWVNYGMTGSGIELMKAIEPESGEVVTTRATETGTRDLCFDGESFLLHNQWNDVDRMDVDGAVVASYEMTYSPSTGRGLACRPDEFWITSSRNDLVVMYDRVGTWIGKGRLTPTAIPSQEVHGSHLTFVGDQLAAVIEGRIYVFTVAPIEE